MDHMYCIVCRHTKDELAASPSSPWSMRVKRSLEAAKRAKPGLLGLDPNRIGIPLQQQWGMKSITCISIVQDSITKISCMETWDAIGMLWKITMVNIVDIAIARQLFQIGCTATNQHMAPSPVAPLVRVEDSSRWKLRSSKEILEHAGTASPAMGATYRCHVRHIVRHCM